MVLSHEVVVDGGCVIAGCSNSSSGGLMLLLMLMHEGQRRQAVASSLQDIGGISNWIIVISSSLKISNCRGSSLLPSPHASSNQVNTLFNPNLPDLLPGLLHVIQQECLRCLVRGFMTKLSKTNNSH